MADIFISYAREDHACASRMAAALADRGWTVFWDRAIPTGKSFDQVIERELDAARCVVVLWSRHSISSDCHRSCIDRAHRLGLLDWGSGELRNVENLGDDRPERVGGRVVRAEQLLNRRTDHCTKWSLCGSHVD